MLRWISCASQVNMWWFFLCFSHTKTPNIHHTPIRKTCRIKSPISATLSVKNISSLWCCIYRSCALKCNFLHTINYRCVTFLTITSQRLCFQVTPLSLKNAFTILVADATSHLIEITFSHVFHFYNSKTLSTSTVAQLVQKSRKRRIWK